MVSRYSMSYAPTRKVDPLPLALSLVRRHPARRRLLVAVMASAALAIGLTAVTPEVAGADEARLLFSGPVSPMALGGHMGLDALGATNAKLCLPADNTTGCPGGYTTAISWNAAGQFPLSGLPLPAGTTTAHLELYPHNRYNDWQSNDPWTDPVGGAHVWIRGLQPGEQRDVGGIPLPAPGDGTAAQTFGAVASSSALTDGRLKINAYQISGLHQTSAAIEVGAFVESFSRGPQWTLGWAWPGQYVAYFTDAATGTSIQGFFTIAGGQAPTLDLDAACFGLDTCQYQRGGPPPAVGTLHPLTPARVLDTRDGTGRGVGPVRPGDGRSISLSSSVRTAEATNHEFRVVGRGGVPATGVSAVLLNVTAVAPTEPGFLTVYPKLARGVRNPGNLDELWDDQSSFLPGYPNSSNLNFRAGEVVPNLVLARVGAGGKVRLNNFAGTVDVVADVVGWFDTGEPTGDGFVGVSPARLLDTRDGTGGIGGRFASGDRRDLAVAGRGGVPADASAVAVNVTAVNPGSAGFVTVWPSGTAMPLASSLNTSPGRTQPNLVVAKLGAKGSISLYDYADFGGTDLLVDVVGYFGTGGGAVTAIDPQRLLDSRTGLDTTAGPFASDEARTVAVGGRAGVPADATAVVLNLTATEPTQAGFLTAWPAGQPRPLASTLNFLPGDNVANLVMVGLGPGGTLSLYEFGGMTHVVADVVGYVTQGA
jgi:hypothetical protein